MLHIQRFEFNPLQENTYLLYNDQGACALIDPGCYFPEERDRLTRFLQSKGLVPKILLNTHCHLDHIFGLNWAYKQFKLPLHLHPDEEIVLDHAPASGIRWGLPFDPFTGPKVYLKEGDRVEIGNHSLEILHVPGHSPGSICFYDATQGFIIAGDVLFKQSVGRTDLPGGSYEQLIQGITQKLFSLPDEVTVYPGHGGETTIGAEKRSNPFFQ